MTMRPTNKVFAKAVRAAVRKIGFAATAIHAWHPPFVPGQVENNLHTFPIRIKVVRQVKKREWMKFFKAFNEALPEGNKSTGMEIGSYRYYEVKLLRKLG